MIISETRTGGRSVIGNKVEAVYSPSREAMYQHNCLIEALPPLLEPEEAERHMRRMPAYSELERSLPPLHRLQAVQKIVNCIIPLPEYIQLEQKFSRMIYNGYLARNPLSAEWVKQMRAAFPDLEWKRGEYDNPPIIRSTAAGFSIFGVSGVGKSTLVESILSLYPQVIVHSEYNGRPFDQQQLVWLKLDCPFDGSPRGLCTAFFQAIDRILGTRYATKYSKGTTDFMMPHMADLAGQLALGALIVDEIQRLKGIHGDGAKNILNFFVQLTSTIGVPVVVLGTYRAVSLFTHAFAGARRIEGQGDVYMHNFACDDFWDYFINTLWRFQWTKVPTALSDPIRNAMYQESQGIADIAVKIYMLAQWQVIGTDDERITPKLIQTVVKEHLHAVGPMLRALRENDTEALAKIEDIRPPLNLLDAALAKATKRTLLTGKMASLRNEELAERSSSEVGRSPHDHLALQLVGAGFDFDIAVRCARVACDRFANETDLKLASVEAFRLALEADGSKKEVAKAAEAKSAAPKKKAKVISLSGDLREIVSKAPKGTTPYEALKEAGIIKSPMEFFPEE